MQRISFVVLMSLLFAAGVRAQIILELSLPTKGAPPYSNWATFPFDFRDADGDGVQDIPMVDKGSTALLVKSGDSNETWEYPMPGNIIANGLEILGFFELNESSPLKEAVFAKRQGRRRFNQPAVLHVAEMAQMNMQFLAAQFLVDIEDADRDGAMELQIYNSGTNMLELWGQGPPLEFFPSQFALKKLSFDVTNLVVTYHTMVNGEVRNVVYRFKQDQTADISVEDEAGNVLISYNSSDANFQIPEGTDEAAGWLLGQNLIRSHSVGVIQLWNDYKDLFPPETQNRAGNALASIGGVIGGILRVIFDLLCRVSSTATCEDDDGTVTITCDCGIAFCTTQQVVYEVVIVETDPATGQQTTRTELRTKDKCVCTCQKLKDTRE
ncbi:MAG: hypothetical protein ONB44_16170 [candidate division KSB1 bacterium]|nr:hypothetical protein [candidate division KSB1 bacterium]MDZ7303669.1 hypothetical protein [candidate division KSB1 bacterium]MDZ7313311.1 hypothetical protein [candidate division KSB1 bacterium]